MLLRIAPANKSLSTNGTTRPLHSCLAVGESPRDEELDPAELAAWTMVASVILNLDETVTKG